jgi:hypothetical protein
MKRGGIGGEEQHRGGDFLWPGQSAKWDRFDQSLFEFLGLSGEKRVSVGPGHTQLTVIACRAISRASDLVSAMTPPLAPA